MKPINRMYIGNEQASFEEKEVIGTLVKIGQENFYKISNVDEMRPFFMSIVSPSNHWIFLSSNGGISAGRKDSNLALFPYYTDDKITESAELTGSKTIFQVQKDGKTHLWEPFSQRYFGLYKTQRNLYKNEFGNKVIFEEINFDLGLNFTYQWNSSDKFGFVKQSKIVNITNQSVKLKVLDGIQNILPYGVGADLQNSTSNLVDAYKKSELETDTGIGIFALSAIIVDKAEPSEALKANMVWSTGIENPIYLLSSLQLDNFRKGKPIYQEVDIKAEKGAYFICTDFTLEANSENKWLTIADVNQSIVSINQIKETINTEANLINLVQEDIALGTKQLLELAGASDGIQLTADKLLNTRHFANTLFNIMRGGIFDNNYQIEKEDYIKYLAKSNKKIVEEKGSLLEKLPDLFNINNLKSIAEKDTDKDFKRLCFEYMPLKFSRRHGDPSRPWNKFSINTRSEVDGSKILDYQGNWRDIFQNWEALAHSYPEFIESMIHKFLNASTFDGYNPYRVTKDGFDWETVEHDNPWSYIGYWGDHQIIYLLKFLEIIENHYPNRLANLFDQEVFVYANVPYKIKEHQAILENPKDTIEFDFELDSEINKRKDTFGADGALLLGNDSKIYHVNFIEKILATVLAKISNFIPEAGIWMNTQRPEWNDANNALVGNGVSMVTLYYLRRFLNFFDEIISKSAMNSLEISEELVAFFDEVYATLNNNKNLLNRKISDLERKLVLDGLGNAGSHFRTNIYEKSFSTHKKTISKSDLKQFIELTLQYIDHSILANKRADNLYHAYNLMTIKNESEIVISYLPEMLEGQVAVLSSGYLKGKDSMELLNALKSSSLFRPDQYSYILYPNKELPRFSNKNNISSKRVEESALLKKLLKDNNTQIIEKDPIGNYHFNGNFNNANSLKVALSALENKYQSLVEKDRDLLLNYFEEVFNHKSFTGRSGTFFGYEGLGSIYWHMVSKLLLSVQETSLKAIDSKENGIIIGKLFDHYFEINEGIGTHKSPKLYGAFPTDPYSHTPAGKGAQQPGMTGQVKEDILSRFGELGVSIEAGQLNFKPNLLRKEEFLNESKTFKYTDVNNEIKHIELEENSLCFTYCQVPIIYKLGDKEGLKLVLNNSSVFESNQMSLDLENSKRVFSRTGKINYIIVFIKK